MSRVHGAHLHRFAGPQNPVQPIKPAPAAAKLPQKDHTAETGPVAHSDRFGLVDRHFRIRGYYHGTAPEALERLRRDLETLRHAERTGQ